MKNLLIYISPTNSFKHPRSDQLANDADKLVKIQIENSLNLGWKVKDILLFTNFDFQYGKVNANVLKNVEFVEWKPQASKINGIVKLFEMELIEDSEIYWFHDLDAFQLHPIVDSELGINKYDMALSDYHIPSRWNTASIFFKKKSNDIFSKIKEVMYEKHINEEFALSEITSNNKNIKHRIKKINTTYNFAPYSDKPCYKEMKVRPIKVIHFHPLAWSPNLFKYEADLDRQLIPDSLIKIFKYHRIV